MFEWQELLNSLLYVVITAVIPVLVTFLVKFLRIKFDQVQEETDQLIINNTVNAALDLILDTVQSTSQTYVDSLKESGEFNEVAQVRAFNQTKDTVMKLLSEESKNILATLYTDLDAWLDTQIEAAVRQTKIIKIEE